MSIALSWGATSLYIIAPVSFSPTRYPRQKFTDNSMNLSLFHTAITKVEEKREKKIREN